MSKKDTLIKKIDEISERVRFWHNAMLALVATVIGTIFGISQEKVDINYFLWFLGIMIASLIVFGLYRLDRLSQDRKMLLDELEKEI